MERDKPHLDKASIFLITPIQVKVQEKGSVIEEEDTTLVIVDEADDIFLDGRIKLKARYCIGLTATPLSE
jgi:ERCC4-related helicase